MENNYNFSLIKFEVLNSVAKITLNRPKALNSFNYEMAEEFQNALDICDKDPLIRCICLCGDERAFSAGQDLKEAISGKMTISEIVTHHYNPIIIKISKIEKPIIAAVQGVAAGAGANIALACDLVFASERAIFIQSFVNIGLIPDSGGTFTLPRLVGRQKANALMMLGEKLSAEEAERIGLIYKVVEHDHLNYEVTQVAEKLAQMPTKGIGLTKRLLSVTYSHTLEEQLIMEMELQELAANSHDYKEGVNAFLEKRKPNFKGE